jgi:hypothetical protein
VLKSIRESGNTKVYSKQLVLHSPTVTSWPFGRQLQFDDSCRPWVGWVLHVHFLLGFQGIETLTCILWNVRTLLIGNQIVSTQPRKGKEKRSASQAGIYIPSRTRGEPNDYTIYLFGAWIDFFGTKQVDMNISSCLVICCPGLIEIQVQLFLCSRYCWY